MASPTLPSPASSGVQTGRQYLVSIAIIGALFFVFGFVTWLNGALIPFLKLACDLQTDAQALFVTFAFYMAYFFLALPAAAILAKTGYKRGMALGLAVMAVGAAVSIPAAQTRSFGLFLTSLFIVGTGLAFLQTASNPYISIIGPLESAAKRISIMGICNKTAGAIGSALFAALLLGGAKDIEEKVNALTTQIDALKVTLASTADAASATAVTATAKISELTAARNADLDALAGRVVTPYIVLVIVLALLALAVLRSPLPEIDTEKSNARANDNAADDAGGSGDATAATARPSILNYPHLLLGVLCLFLYMGVEIMAGDAIGLYGKAMSVPTDKSGFLTSFTLGAMVIGYIGGIIAIPRFIKQEQALGLCAVLGAVFTAGAYLTGGITAILFGWLPVSVLFVALLGLANSLMWPAIFPLAIAGLGRFTNLGSAFLIMAIAGGALIPQFYARSQAWFGISFQLAFLICMLPCYAYILYYALAGHKTTKQQTKPPTQ
ncbi:MAG: glucose/galactose MFS transporter [Puniceicoccales bacterium]|jgi:glucose/galactose transporter|nr:glucose/galactose MFS transporter [Puniceicoccales bacterium]